MSKHFDKVPNYSKKHDKIEPPSFLSMPRKSPKLSIQTDIKCLRETGSTLCPTPKNIQGLQAKDFIFLKMLGKGKFGSVYLAMHKQTGFILAIKVINKSILNGISKEQTDKITNQLIREIKIQMFLQHPNLISLYSFFHDTSSIYLLMEVGCGGQLYEIMTKNKTFSEEAISFVIRQILQGANYMHSHYVIHRDLKPQNIVLQHGVPKICDFGWAVYCPKQFRSTLCGTPLYLSPEILKGDGYNEKIDTWAIGTLTYELLNGDNPFSITKKSEIIKIVTDQLEITKGSSTLKQFIHWALIKNPKQRPKSSDLLGHLFIQKYKQLQTCEQICSQMKPITNRDKMKCSWKKI